MSDTKYSRQVLLSNTKTDTSIRKPKGVQHKLTHSGFMFIVASKKVFVACFGFTNSPILLIDFQREMDFNSDHRISPHPT